MRLRTALAVVAIVVLLGGAGAYGLLGQIDSTGELSTLWVSDTETSIKGNHHAPAVAQVGDETLVFAPISGKGGSNECALVALEGTSGNTQWRYEIPREHCTLHAVADPTVADVTGDGRVEVLAATTENRIVALDPENGEIRRSHNLSSYGYTQPVVADIVGDRKPETLVVDVKGVAFAFGNGGAVWQTDLGGSVWAQPVVADLDADGRPEVAVGVGTTDGEVVSLEANGSQAWKHDGLDGAVTWMTAGQADDDRAIEVIAATTGGTVVAFDGTDGSVEWRRTLGAFAAVRAFGDGDGDGSPEVYAVSRDGKLYALSGSNGTTEWTTTLTTGNVQMAPPPVLGDLDGDGTPELVAATNDGIVAVVEPTTGEIVATYERDVPIYTYPAVADLDGEPGAEMIVTYGDGRVVALSFTSEGRMS